jgi:hypothetical protein
MVSDLPAYPFPTEVAKNNSSLRTMFANVQLSLLEKDPELMVQMLEIRRHHKATVEREYAPQMVQKRDGMAVKRYGQYMGLPETMWPTTEPLIVRYVEQLAVPFKHVVSNLTWFQAQKLYQMMLHLEIDQYAEFSKIQTEESDDWRFDGDEEKRQDLLYGMVRISSVVGEIAKNWEMLAKDALEGQFGLLGTSLPRQQILRFPSPMRIAGVPCVLDEQVNQLPVCSCCENPLSTHSIVASTLELDECLDDGYTFVSGFHPLVSQKTIFQGDGGDGVQQLRELIDANTQLQFLYCGSRNECHGTFTHAKACSCQSSFTFIVSEMIDLKSQSKTLNEMRRLGKMLYK